MVQYHALGLLYHIRKTDRLAVKKLVEKFTRATPKSPYAVCMLVSIYLIKYLKNIFFFAFFKSNILRFALPANYSKKKKLEMMHTYSII